MVLVAAVQARARVAARVVAKARVAVGVVLASARNHLMMRTVTLGAAVVRMTILQGMMVETIVEKTCAWPCGNLDSAIRSAAQVAAWSGLA